MVPAEHCRSRFRDPLGTGLDLFFQRFQGVGTLRDVFGNCRVEFVLGPASERREVVAGGWRGFMALGSRRPMRFSQEADDGFKRVLYVFSLLQLVVSRPAWMATIPDLAKKAVGVFDRLDAQFSPNVRQLVTALESNQRLKTRLDPPA